MKRQLLTVLIFTKLNTRRFFRDKVALFFGIAFPLMILVIVGSFSSGGGNVSFKVALINQSDTAFARHYAAELSHSKTFKINKQATTLAVAKDKLSKSQVDGIIVLPKGFGSITEHQTNPSGQISVLYTSSSTGTGQTLATVLQGTLATANKQYVGTISQPFSVTGQVLNERQLSSFDYAFAGLLGFSIIGLGIFGPINVFPELKKQGILRRLHTTPLRVWQYFLATMFTQAIAAIVAVTLQFVVAIAGFHLRVIGNYFEIALFVVLGVFLILGIGLAIGGWAKSTRQSAPIGNLIAFPMLFLSGTFVPRFLLPEFLQTITNYLPLTPIIDGLRILITEGGHLVNLGPQLAVMAAWFVIIYTTAFRVFKWE
jgi:ABC-2 type transport system permease protein